MDWIWSTRAIRLDSGVRVCMRCGGECSRRFYLLHYANQARHCSRFRRYPMPTIALMNGHAFAGALMLAMMHDYRIMNPHRGYLCLNELELGVPLRPPMSSVFRQKVSPQTYRRMVLEAARFKACFPLLVPSARGRGKLIVDAGSRCTQGRHYRRPRRP